MHSNHTGHNIDTAYRIAPGHRSLVGIDLLPALLRQVAHRVLHPLGWFSCINMSKTLQSLSALRLGLLPAIKPLTLAGCYWLPGRRSKRRGKNTIHGYIFHKHGIIGVSVSEVGDEMSEGVPCVRRAVDIRIVNLVRAEKRYLRT